MFDTVEITVGNTKQYDIDMKNLGYKDKKRARDIRKDLINGLYLVNNKSPMDNTHYLKDYSKQQSYLRFTKDLNLFGDRFDYLIYKPVLDKINRKVTISIIIQSLIDHNIYGQGTYTEIEKD